ncbi:reductive dehalogenase [Dehalogenimonas formicexedens]|uniref:Reductive dehalogenase n=1 Tax=Dehalogenimonas formicexedens TaxID=1839801 RepID=A0A1P8F8D4_9CHLR|nr:reductive dehalogenase [Dehalogenimonas formicexedens]APV44662.1 reductive dehalogenase [Dehalogenimonas formicexedens]
MRNFHATLSRRDFMKSLGLAGSGLGAAAVIAPSFHDLDEVLSSKPQSEWKNPWWVKERDYENPTIDVDWDMYPTPPVKDQEWGTEQTAKTNDLIKQLYGSNDSDELNKKWAQQGMQGMALRDQALENACTCCNNGLKTNFAGISPESLGVAKWQGSPEENLHMMRVASRFFGSYWSGSVELNQKTLKVIAARRDGLRRTTVFEAGAAYKATTTQVTIPKGSTNVFNWIIQHPQHALGTGPGSTNNPYGYFFATNTSARVRQFIQNLGYSQANPSVGSGAMSTLSGVTEMSRMGANVIVPSHGAMPRICDAAVTDLPLAYTPPVDSGIFRFCRTCKKCAENCPTGSMSLETEPSWDVADLMTNIGGLKHYYLNYATCNPFKSSMAPGYCGICLSGCVFRNFNDSMIHPVIQAVVTQTTIFDGFFTNMDRIVGYKANQAGDKAHQNDRYVDEWWNTIGPELGFLTHFGSHQ